MTHAARMLVFEAPADEDRITGAPSGPTDADVYDYYEVPSLLRSSWLYDFLTFLYNYGVLAEHVSPHWEDDEVWVKLQLCSRAQLGREPCGDELCQQCIPTLRLMLLMMTSRDKLPAVVEEIYRVQQQCSRVREWWLPQSVGSWVSALIAYPVFQTHTTARRLLTRERGLIDVGEDVALTVSAWQPSWGPGDEVDNICAHLIATINAASFIGKYTALRAIRVIRGTNLLLERIYVWLHAIQAAHLHHTPVEDFWEILARTAFNRAISLELV